MEFKVLHPQSSAGAGARWSDRRSAQRARREGSSESNRMSFQEWGAASLVNVLVGFLFVFLLTSWFNRSRSFALRANRRLLHLMPAQTCGFGVKASKGAGINY